MHVRGALIHLFMQRNNVDHTVFGDRAGLERNRPAGSTGRHEKRRISARFRSVDAVIRADRKPDLSRRKNVPAVRMTGDHKVSTGFRFRSVIIRLMIQHDRILVRIQRFCQFLRGFPLLECPIEPSRQIL